MLEETFSKCIWMTVRTMFSGLQHYSLTRSFLYDPSSTHEDRVELYDYILLLN